MFTQPVRVQVALEAMLGQNQFCFLSGSEWIRFWIPEIS
jgi:hypothetical protein